MPIASVRALDANGDMQWGRGKKDFLSDVPEVVGQRVKTRMGLWTGDWSFDLKEGTPYRIAVLGMRTNPTRDPALRSRVLGTLGCTGITSYASQVDRATRAYTVQATIQTRFGETTISTAPAASNGDVRYVR